MKATHTITAQVLIDALQRVPGDTPVVFDENPLSTETLRAYSCISNTRVIDPSPETFPETYFVIEGRVLTEEELALAK